MKLFLMKGLFMLNWCFGLEKKALYQGICFSFLFYFFVGQGVAASVAERAELATALARFPAVALSNHFEAKHAKGASCVRLCADLVRASNGLLALAHKDGNAHLYTAGWCIYDIVHSAQTLLSLVHEYAGTAQRHEPDEEKIVQSLGVFAEHLRQYILPFCEGAAATYIAWNHDKPEYKKCITRVESLGSLVRLFSDVLVSKEETFERKLTLGLLVINGLAVLYEFREIFESKPAKSLNKPTKPLRKPTEPLSVEEDGQEKPSTQKPNKRAVERVISVVDSPFTLESSDSDIDVSGSESGDESSTSPRICRKPRAPVPGTYDASIDDDENSATSEPDTFDAGSENGESGAESGDESPRSPRTPRTPMMPESEFEASGMKSPAASGYEDEDEMPRPLSDVASSGDESGDEVPDRSGAASEPLRPLPIIQEVGLPEVPDRGGAVSEPLRPLPTVLEQADALPLLPVAQDPRLVPVRDLMPAPAPLEVEPSAVPHVRAPRVRRNRELDGLLGGRSQEEILNYKREVGDRHTKKTPTRT